MDEVEQVIDCLWPPGDGRDAARLAIANVVTEARLAERLSARVVLAILKMSDGRGDKLEQAIELSHEDWRDTLMAADFGTDLRAHLTWARTTIASD